MGGNRLWCNASYVAGLTLQATGAGGLTRLLERARHLHENGADSHRLRQYVQRWVTWLHGGLQGLVKQNRFNQIWDCVDADRKLTSLEG